MTAMASVMTGAASGFEVTWHSIDWAKAHQTVRRLQVRIAKAVTTGSGHTGLRGGSSCLSGN